MNMIRKICAGLGELLGGLGELLRVLIFILMVVSVPFLGAIFTVLIIDCLFHEIYEWEPIEVLPIMLLGFGLHLGLTYLIINNK